MVLEKIPTMNDVMTWVNNNANVPEAYNALRFKGNDLDTNGDGVVNSSDYATNAGQVDGYHASEIPTRRNVKHKSGSVSNMNQSRTKQGSWNINNGILLGAMVGEEATGNYSSTKSQLVIHLDNGNSFNLTRSSSGEDFRWNTYNPINYGGSHAGGLVDKIEWYTEANDDDNSDPAGGHTAKFRFVVEEMSM